MAATLGKVTYTKRVPKSAEIVEVDGQQFARFKRKGRWVNAPLVGDGTRCRLETDEYYIRYQDVNGEWKRLKAKTDERASRRMLEDVQTRLDQKEAGVNPYQDHIGRSLFAHLDEWKADLLNQGTASRQQVDQVVYRAERVIDGCGFELMRDIKAAAVKAYLARRREMIEAKTAPQTKPIPDRAKRFRNKGEIWIRFKQGRRERTARTVHDGRRYLDTETRERPLSVQTSNHYLESVKRFTAWLVSDGRTGSDALAELAELDVTEDKIQHPRRAISADDFEKLVRAAAASSPVESIAGPDRAMLYILAAWTGFRRKELSSLTRRSFDLDAQTPTVRVNAAYAKNKRTDSIPLHPVVAERVRAWLNAKGDVGANAPMFALRTAGGHWRKTAKMMRTDCEAAGVPYCDEDGLFADFHANRHTFITNLGRSGVPLGTGQKLARHSDPKLTSNIYTHLAIHDKAAGIDALPAPPTIDDTDRLNEAAELRATGTDDQAAERPGSAQEGRSSGGENEKRLPYACHGTDPTRQEGARSGTKWENSPSGADDPEAEPQTVKLQDFGTPCHDVPSEVLSENEVHPRGFEPLTFGSVDRCSIQLS